LDEWRPDSTTRLRHISRRDAVDPPSAIWVGIASIDTKGRGIYYSIRVQAFERVLKGSNISDVQLRTRDPMHARPANLRQCSSKPTTSACHENLDRHLLTLIGLEYHSEH
jgi:hypothetical protein